MSAADPIVRAIGLNERFQLLAVVYDEASYSAACDILPAAAKALVGTDHIFVDMLAVTTGEEAIEHVLSSNPSLTVFEAHGLSRLEVERFFSVINSNRDTMGATRVPSTLLVLVSRDLLPAISLVAQDIWSCRSITVMLTES